MTQPTPAYINQLLAAHRAGKVPSGTMSVAVVSHDDWCDLLTQGRTCNCEPETKVVSLNTTN